MIAAKSPRSRRLLAAKPARCTLETTINRYWVANTASAALESGNMLSDNPYGDLDPIAWLGARLYVPDMAVGRLVESPTDIDTSLDQFASSGGVLDASKALAAGYDFMADGAQAAGAALQSSLTAANGG